MRISDWSSDVCSADLQRSDEQGVRESIAQLDALIAREGERGIPASRIILAGFSQGGAIVLSAALRRQQAVAGVMALRSEEHTSELQSLMRISYAVFCLKKKK